MELEETLKDISQRLKDGGFSNEQSISQGVVLRILSELGWPVYDTAVVWPEYPTGEGRVDFALCDPPKMPKCFVEVKQQGKAEDGVEQALGYAFQAGVQFVVLTDGRTWSFYLPAEQGSYEDRRVFKLDLFERTHEEAAQALWRYLERGRVVSGQAQEDAVKEYRDRSRRLRARQAIPEAWKELVERGDELLRDLLIDAVESKVGVRPDNEDIAVFLAGLEPSGSHPEPPVSTRLPSRRAASAKDPPKPPAISTTDHTLAILGEIKPCRTVTEAMVLVLAELAKRDPTFLKRCSDHEAFRGTKRRYIAKRVDDLYPGIPVPRSYQQLPGGWFVGTHSDSRRKQILIKAATDVAGLTFGKDVVVKF